MARLLIVLALYAWCAGAGTAQSLLGVKQDKRDGEARPGTGRAKPRPCSEQPDELSRILCKLQREERLTERELVVYIRAVEERNPGKNRWGQIISKFHFRHYAYDAELVLSGIRLFQNGPENEGWRDVNELAPSPKFIDNDAGAKVDIAHSYAGVRALVERYSVNTWLMGKVNTHWGDNFQVLDGKIRSILKYTKGAFTLNYRESWDAMDDWGKANRYHPPDQRLGNDIGMAVMEKIKANRGLALSAGYSSVLGE